MEVGFFYKDVFHEARLKYVLDFISDHPLNSSGVRFVFNERRDSNIYYSQESSIEGAIHIPSQQYFFIEGSRTSLDLVANSYIDQETELFSVEAKKKPDSSFLSNNKIGFDILECIFFHLTRIEELNIEKTYQNDREQLSEELLFLIRQRLEKRPVVDQVVFSFLKILAPGIKQTPTEYHLSHDIDFIQKFKSSMSFLRLAARSLIKGGFRKVWAQYASWKMDVLNDPYNNFDVLLSESKNISKTIYFLVDGYHKYDNIYDLSHPIFKSALRIAQDRGYRIGIHPSFLAWKSGDVVRGEKQKLERATNINIDCSRQHYLHFHPIATVEALLEAGIKEDASIGYTNAIGFKCGTGFSYYLYDFKNENRSLLKEVPLVYMDSAAVNEAIRQEIDLEDLTQSFLMSNLENTQINFNFHNSRLDPANANYEALRRSYEAVQMLFDPSQKNDT